MPVFEGGVHGNCYKTSAMRQAPTSLRNILRIDNRRQSVIRPTLHYSVATSYTVFYHIPNDSSYFCLSDQTKDVLITPFFFQKL